MQHVWTAVCSASTASCCHKWSHSILVFASLPFICSLSHPLTESRFDLAFLLQLPDRRSGPFDLPC